MAFLYPRLEKSEAILIAEDLRGRTLERFDDPQGTIDFGKATTKPTGGVPVSVEHLQKLRLGVFEALSGIEENISGSTWTDEYDRRLGKALWENLEMIPGDSGSPEVWYFLSLIVFPNTCNTRYSFTDEDNLHRHIGPVRRTYLKNLWVRRRIYGSILDEGLSVFSDDLHFQITDRVVARTTPNLCHAIINTLMQTPDVSRVFYRRFLREVQAVASYVPFALLPDTELRNLVHEVAVYAADALGVGAPVRRAQMDSPTVDGDGSTYSAEDATEQEPRPSTNAMAGLRMSEEKTVENVQISKPSKVRRHFESFKATSEELRIASDEARQTRYAEVTAVEAVEHETQLSAVETNGGISETLQTPVGNPGDVSLVNSFTLRTWRKIYNKLDFRGLLDDRALQVFEEFLEGKKSSNPIAATLMMRYMATALERGIMKPEEIMRKIKQ